MAKRKKKKFRFLKALLAIVVFLGVIYGGYYVWFKLYAQKDSVLGGNWSKTDAFDINAVKGLGVNSRTEDDLVYDFKILQVADTHFILGNSLSDKKTYDLIGKAIDEGKPDLVVFTGDTFASPFTGYAARALCDFMEEKQQYWAYVFGNHDSEYGISKTRIAEIMLQDKYPHCLFQTGPDGSVYGKSNYFIKLTKGGDIVYALSFFDSNMYTMNLNPDTNEEEKYAYIRADQADYYEWGMKGIAEAAGKGSINNAAFFHIPLPEYLDLYKNPGADFTGERNELSEGIWTEGVSSARPFYKDFDDACDVFAVLKANNCKAIFVGHDHVNNFRGTYDGIYLAYGRGAGFSAYPYIKGSSGLGKLVSKISADPVYSYDYERAVNFIYLNTTTGGISVKEFTL